MSRSEVNVPVRRVLAILHFLTEHPDTVYTRDELIEVLGRSPYDTVVADRTLEKDLQALDDCGLVLRGQRHADGGRKRGVMRNPWIPKASGLRLTMSEHAALQAMRKALGGRMPTVAPGRAPSAQVARTNNRVGDALLAVRLIEESGVAERGDVAAALGVSDWRTVRWLNQIVDALGADVVDLQAPDSNEWTMRDVRGAELVRSGIEDDGTHLLGTGTDLLGLFPYSIPEAEERLALLADYAAVDEDRAVSDEVLREIRWKLESWIEFLRVKG